MDVVITVLLDLQQKSQFRKALGGKGLQQWAVLLWKKIMRENEQNQNKDVRERSIIQTAAMTAGDLFELLHYRQIHLIKRP